MFVERGLEFVTLSVLVLEPVAVRGLLGAIAADRHAAPSPRPPPGTVGEHQRAAMSLARFDVGEVFFTHKPCQDLADRQQQRFGRTPAPHHSKFQAIAIGVAMPRYLAERFITFQEPIQRTQRLERPGRERPAHMFANEASEPLAQSTSLIRNLVQFTWHRARLQLVECMRRNNLGLSQPLQQAIAAVEPVDRRVDRCRDGVQKVQTERVGDKNCRWSVLHDWPRSTRQKVPIA